MGGRHSKSERSGEASSSSSADDTDGRESAPPEMLAFLETTSGSKWLAGILLGTESAKLRGLLMSATLQRPQQLLACVQEHLQLHPLGLRVQLHNSADADIILTATSFPFRLLGPLVLS